MAGVKSIRKYLQVIFLAGLAHSPRFIEESVTMAKSAGQQAMKVLCKEKMTTSAAVAEVDTEKCAACLICVRVCPYGAPFINEKGDYGPGLPERLPKWQIPPALI